MPWGRFTTVSGGSSFDILHYQLVVCTVLVQEFFGVPLTFSLCQGLFSLLFKKGGHFQRCCRIEESFGYK
jgi:hypothetical protein